MAHGQIKVSPYRLSETPDTVSQWALDTFGPAGTNMSCVTRANKEMSELLYALSIDDNHPDLGKECADIIIVLWRTMKRAGYEPQVEIDKKMRINRERKWLLDGNGHGSHIKEEKESDLIHQEYSSHNDPSKPEWLLRNSKPTHNID